MRVVIAGGHGQVALRLERRLSEAGHEPVGLVRNPAHVPDVEAAGAEAVVLDLERVTAVEVAAVTQGADAVVFAAGGGPGSGADRKETVDKGAAILLADAAQKVGVRRYVMISSMGTDAVDPTADDIFSVYLRAKRAADEHLRDTDLDWTIIQPGRLTDGPGTGKVTLDPAFEPRVTEREDVAAAIAVALEEPATIRKQFALLNGDTPIAEALRSL